MADRMASLQTSGTARGIAFSGALVWGGVVDDVGLVGVGLQVVLVIVLGAKEGFEGHDLGDNFPGIDLGGIELLDVGAGDALLFLIGIENGRAILRAVVRPLAIELRGVVRDGEKDH